VVFLINTCPNIPEAGLRGQALSYCVRDKGALNDGGNVVKGKLPTQNKKMSKSGKKKSKR
jgi:hypothetical protein